MYIKKCGKKNLQGAETEQILTFHVSQRLTITTWNDYEQTNKNSLLRIISDKQQTWKTN